MGLEPPALAQIEFHVSPTTPVEALVAESHIRLASDSRLMTVVRIFDLDGALKRKVRDVCATEEALDKAISSCASSRGIARRFHDWKAKRLAGKALRLRNEACSLSKKKLEVQLTGGLGVATERDSRGPFRFVQDSEKHELFESASRAEHARIHIFSFAELTAEDRLTSIVSC